MAKASRQPFFLMASSHDPHDPFPGTGAEKSRLGKPHYERAAPSRTFSAEEVRVPGFLPDLPAIRRELAAYSNSVRRMDDMVGGILDELDRAGLTGNTIVIFLSDHGMGFPGAKGNCYVQSTRSPWIVRWPGQVAAGSHDRTHMVSAVDLQPTILEAVGLPPVEPSDGRSFLSLLRGQPQENRDHVFTQFFHI
ncbi:MAG: sulfatase-like hydrolase/transferase, partial [Akkermansiaceae bacterium]|nr:sulfatase-like hydrolase/transferase [Akkermansiaceae bacterium]